MDDDDDDDDDKSVLFARMLSTNTGSGLVRKLVKVSETKEKLVYGYRQDKK